MSKRARRRANKTPSEASLAYYRKEYRWGPTSSWRTSQRSEEYHRRGMVITFSRDSTGTVDRWEGPDTRWTDRFLWQCVDVQTILFAWNGEDYLVHYDFLVRPDRDDPNGHLYGWIYEVGKPKDDYYLGGGFSLLSPAKRHNIIID